MKKVVFGLFVLALSATPGWAAGLTLAFADGTRATGAIAAAEVQGYVYDAKLRCAELAREVGVRERHSAGGELLEPRAVHGHRGRQLDAGLHRDGDGRAPGGKSQIVHSFLFPVFLSDAGDGNHRGGVPGGSRAGEDTVFGSRLSVPGCAPCNTRSDIAR